MKLLLENWRKFIVESNKRIGVLNSNHSGEVYTHGLYSSNMETATAGVEGQEVEIISGWQDQGVEWKLINVDGIEGWIESDAIDMSEKNQNAYSFDFDNTLIRYQTLEDGDVVYLGPHEENLQILKDLAAEGNKVIIVTSRFKLKGPKKPWDDAPTPEELVADLNLPVEVIEYTDGELKTSKLLGLPYNIIKHWDDDQDEINALADTGIQGVKVEVPGEETERLRAKWVHNLSQELQEGGMEIPEGMRIYLKNHPYMEPDGLQEAAEPKKGTGKKPKGSGRRLYTDEDPSDTVSVKFRTIQDVKDTFSKTSFKSKSHKRQSQIINLVHQRVRSAYQNAKDPKTKARLKKVLDYAEKRKATSKEKTKRLQKKKD